MDKKKRNTLMGKMKNEFCTICGRKMSMIWNGSYSSETGEKIYIPECDVKDCKHNYHQYKKFSFSTIMGIGEKCIKCGAFNVYD